MPIDLAACALSESANKCLGITACAAGEHAGVLACMACMSKQPAHRMSLAGSQEADYCHACLVSIACRQHCPCLTRDILLSNNMLAGAMCAAADIGLTCLGITEDVGFDGKDWKLCGRWLD